MLSRSAIACLLASCLTATAAFSQAPAQPPAEAGSTDPTGQQGASLTPLANPGPGQMLTSDLRGTTVYGANDEKIGDINDVLIDRDGRTVAVIVGVGGFLGIGQKNVAIPYQALDVMAENTPDRATSPVPTTAGNAERNMIGDPAATGSVNATGPGTDNPSRIILRKMTKADLENAPNFNRRGIGMGFGTAPADGANATTNQ